MSNEPNELWNVELIKKKGPLRHFSRRGSSVQINNSASFSKKRSSSLSLIITYLILMFMALYGEAPDN